MKQKRQNSFFGQNLTDEQILKKIRRELGQGDWKIDFHRSGSMVNWVAEKETPTQGPQ